MSDVERCAGVLSLTTNYGDVAGVSAAILFYPDDDPLESGTARGIRSERIPTTDPRYAGLRELYFAHQNNLAGVIPMPAVPKMLNILGWSI